MNICLEDVTNYLKPLLLSDLEIRTDRKVLKKGKLRFFKVKQYNIALTLEHEGKSRTVEIPYPFKVEQDDTHVMFNYHLSSFLPAGDVMSVKCLDSSDSSRLYNNLLHFWPK